MKFNLVTLHLAVVLQFLETKPYVAHTFKKDNHVVTVRTGGQPAVLVSGVTKEGKTSYNITVQVPNGDGFFNPVVTLTGDNEARDTIAKLINEAIKESGTAQADANPVVIAPEA